MKIQSTQSFAPITINITLENADEHNLFLVLMGATVSIPAQLLPNQPNNQRDLRKIMLDIYQAANNPF